MNSYRDVISWQRAMSLVNDVYELTLGFPSSEQFGLTNQMRRCSVSIPSNIAEGFGRNSMQEFIRFLNIARGSLFELQTQMEISKNLKFLNNDSFNELYTKSEEVEKLINALVKSIKTKLNSIK